MKRLFILPLLLITSSCLAQLTTGTLIYDIEYHMPSIDSFMVQEMAGSSSLEIAFTPQFLRVDNASGPDSKNTAIIDKKSRKVLLLSDNYGSKQALEGTMDQLEAMQEAEESFVRTDYSATKTILGYTCNKATATVADAEMVFWYTKEIEFGVQAFGVPNDVPGVCLEYGLVMQKMSVEYAVKEIKKGTPDLSLFSLIVPEEYENPMIEDAIDNEVESIEEAPALMDPYSEVLNKENGIDIFKIDAKKYALKKFLKKGTADNLGHSTSAHQIKLKKAKLKEFHGLKILEGEVRFNGEIRADGKTINEDVFEIAFKCELPKTKEEDLAFRALIEDHYGYSEYMYNPDYTRVVRYFWYSDITLLYVNFEDIETGKELPHVLVTFAQSYGG